MHYHDPMAKRAKDVSTDPWRHSHRFTVDRGSSERNTWLVIALTAVMMVIEIASGLMFGSMALLADGWHMATHTAALGITAFAYTYARRHADDPAYTFGTGKVGVLGGFASAIVLAIIAVLMGAEAVVRLLTPKPIQFNEAIFVAVIGLGVNLVSAWLLRERHDHSHGHGSEEHRHHQDHNLRAAYLHVLADALTSVLAIVALLTGKALGWIWMDPLMGVVGGVIILRWAYMLIRDTGHILLDKTAATAIMDAVRSEIESEDDSRVVDLHLWQVSSSHLGAIVSIVTKRPKPPDYYKSLLNRIQPLDHITVEVIPYVTAPEQFMKLSDEPF
ncbi:Cobalt/zinc/cadmium resistance protein CzcD [Olavius algarvensis associated proteobacterium Delta 3]|nr:Cobalt/zinc/cadmium resistance protein CzcD [Olavius algarvensis associated proteobacterium Delta 3]